MISASIAAVLLMASDATACPSDIETAMDLEQISHMSGASRDMVAEQARALSSLSLDADQPERLSLHQNKQDMDAASNVIERHIEETEKYTISADPDTWTRLSSLAGKVDPNDIAQIAKIVTQSYSEVASMWVDLAGKLREVLNVQSTSKEASGAVPLPEGLTVCIQSQRRVSAKVRMFEAGPIQRVQPLLAEAAEQTAMIRDVEFDNGQINILVQPDIGAGTYHGMLLSPENKPVGAITVTVPNPDQVAP